MDRIPTTLVGFTLYVLKPHKMYIFALLLVGISFASHISLVPHALKNIINAANSSEVEICDLIEPAFTFVLFAFTASLTMRGFEFFGLNTQTRVQKYIRQTVMRYAIQHSYGYFQNNFTGSIASKINDIASSMNVIIVTVFHHLIPMSIATIIAFTVAYSVHPFFMIIFTVWSIGFLTIITTFARKTKQYSKTLSQSRAMLSGTIIDIFNNINHIRSFANDQFELANVNKDINQVFEDDVKMRTVILRLNALSTLNALFLNSSLVAGLTYAKINNLITIGDFGLILVLTKGLLESLWHLSYQFVTFSQEVGSASHAISILSEPLEIVDKSDANKLVVTDGKIEFKDIHFFYKDSKRLFSNLNVTINANERVGIVGFSGVGKTTFINLIIRNFDAQSGQLLIDNQNIYDKTQSSVRDCITLIPQDISLFHRSIKDNISYGNQDATDEDIYQASKLAKCHEFIMDMPDQYNSLVGERGIKLSTGQRQRISIARALLKKKTKIIILDEATSALDTVTEKHIQDGLEYVMENRTTIAIAHRLSTLEKMERILVFGEGKIVEDGTHQALMDKKGLYYKLWNMQTHGILPNNINKWQDN